MRRSGIVLGCWLGLAATAHAEAEKPAETADAILIKEDEAWPRILHDALNLPGWLDLGFEQRTRFEFLNGPFRPGEAETQTQYPQRTRLRVGVNGPEGVRFLAEVQDSRTWDDGVHDFTGSEIDKVSLTQLFVSVTRPDVLGTGLRADVHLGRMSLDFGSRRLIARNSFRNTTNAFDGVHVQLAEAANWRIRTFFVWTANLNPAYFRDTNQGPQRLWGAYFEDREIPWLNFELYYFGLHDGLGSGSTTQRNYSTFGSRWLRAAKVGQLDYELEPMYQVGQRTVLRSGVPVKLDQRAYAAHAELGYTFDAAWTPRLAAQFDYASGTANPTGDGSETFFQLFGARRFDLVATGIYGPFTRSNILSPGGRLQVSPLPNWKGWLKVRYWRLAQAKDAFVGTGLSDPTGNAGRNLGTDLELSVQWTPRPWITLETGYDHWWKGSYLDEVPQSPSTLDSNYFYFSVMFRV